MLPYFPPAYPDELLYSLLARFHRHMGETSPKRTLDMLFGNRSVRAGVLLQGHLGDFSSHLPTERHLTPVRLLMDFTLYPYLTAFQPAEVRQSVQDALIAGHGDWINVRLGLAASQIQAATALRYCPACRQEMLTRHGELYWRRDHQLPGVFVCPDHGIPLQDSLVRPGTVGQHDFLAADEGNCPDIAADSVAQAAVPWRMAQRCADLLRNPPDARPLHAWGETYRQDLRRRGFGKGDERVDQKKLSQAFAQWQGKPDGGGDWLAAMARKHRKAFQPYHHMLLQLFLDAQAPVAETSPFGPGPWSCRNPLADHFGQPVALLADTHREDGRLIGRFICSCGYAFSLAAAPDSKPRILDLGPLFRQRLCDLVASGQGLRATARALAVDPGTVLRHAERLGLAVPWALLKPRPSVPRSERQRSLPAALQPSSPPRKDWGHLDHQLSAALVAEAKRIKALLPPVRASGLLLQSQFGRRGWLRSRLAKLPMTADALAREQESIEQFRLRRIAWAASELRQQGLSLKPWRLRRLAGLGAKTSPLVEAALKSYEGP